MLPANGGRVGYVLKMYPRLAETFILNEILAHEAAGLELDLFSLRSPIDGHFHHDLAHVRAGVTYLGGPSVKAEEYWKTLCQMRDEMPGGGDLEGLFATESAADMYQGMLLAIEVRARGITHLHAHFATVATSVARIAARITGVSYSFTAHAKDIFHESVIDDDLERKLRDASSVITVSDYNVDFLRDRFGDASSSVRRVYNGLDLGEFAFTPPVDRGPLVLGVGRLVDKKGFADLISACAILKERGRSFECEIIGHGVLRDKLDAHVAKLGVGDVVTLTGPRPRSLVVERLRQAAVMAAPCVVSNNGNRDGLPTVLLEAMALGTPCISTDVTGIPEVVRDDETALLTPQNEPTALADAIERLLDDPALGARLAAEARRLIEAEFDIHGNTPKLRELFAAGAAGAAPPAVPAGVG